MAQKATFELIIARVNEQVFRGAAHSITAPGRDGVITVLPNHEPLIALLKAGLLTVRTDTGEQEFSITHGLLETSNGQVTVLL